MQQLVLTNIPMDHSFFIVYIYTLLAKIGLHALYMLNSVLFATLIAQREKGFEKIDLPTVFQSCDKFPNSKYKFLCYTLQIHPSITLLVYQ